ncbi:small acid-soluble spore protein SspI [Lysinibacillus sp. KU-BSD001]|uniref:small acid-soluble spore protein SspI n=1 Tax=Lysinibacillus sp. KU-BSD001 TaxID=3141328 RepID=UPI0036F0312C
MSFQIREAITTNVTGDSAAVFNDTINDAIARGEEHLLPGLGVFLEAWWKDASENERNAFTSKLEKHFVS